MNNTFALVSEFIEDRISPFKKELENSTVFLNMLHEQSEMSATIESAVMELCHGSCHQLTIGLADLFEIQECLLITTEVGIPIHSALLNKNKILDGNGIHEIENSLKFWSSITREKCIYRIIEIEELCGFIGFDEESYQMAVEDFEYIAEFILKNIEDLM